MAFRDGDAEKQTGDEENKLKYSDSVCISEMTHEIDGEA
jgi:hypothetical protein